MANEDVGVTITLKEIYDELRTLVLAVSPLPAKIAEHAVQIEKQDIRISGIEKKIWMAAGAASVIGSVFGVLGPAILGK